MVGGQILIIFVGGAAFGVTRLSGWQWGVCLGFAVFCIPWAAVLKLVPDRYVAGLLSWCGKVMKALWVPVVKAYGGMVWGTKRCVRPVSSKVRSGKVRVADEESARLD
ncbi:hypothetical protein BJX61DRAFT_522636 [Aspergillus egyptiacus]|nr:hypothetical protein BJX61DRAFT_522636 [Aspergillus egyptiacus]